VGVMSFYIMVRMLQGAKQELAMKKLAPKEAKV